MRDVFFLACDGLKGLPEVGGKRLTVLADLVVDVLLDAVAPAGRCYEQVIRHVCRMTAVPGA